MRLLQVAPLFVLPVVGCGKSEAIPINTVTGQVIYDGKPAVGVQVFFMPENGMNPAGVPSNPHAVTDSDGNFSLSTMTDGDGAPAGDYRVVLLWPREKEAEEEEETPDRLFGWHDARHTKLTVQVKEGANALPPFKLAKVTGPPPISEGVPGRN